MKTYQEWVKPPFLMRFPKFLAYNILAFNFSNEQDEAKRFSFRHGPIFSQVVLADELNRASPKTQSALLEAMEERQVSIDGVTHALPCWHKY